MMKVYEIRYKKENGSYITGCITAADSGRAIVTWRRQNPNAKLIWMKRLDDGLPIIQDRRLPPEPD